MKNIEIYVTPNGSDLGDGSKRAPFATIFAAQRAASRYRRDGKRVFVNIKAGNYYLDRSVSFSAADAGMPETPIVYRGYGKGKPTFIGGRAVSKDKISKLTDKALLSRIIDKSARSKVYKIDLSDFKDYLVADFCATGDKSYSAFRLYENDEAMNQARYPKKRAENNYYGEYLPYKKVEYKGLADGYEKKIYYCDEMAERMKLWDLTDADMGIAGIFSHAWCHENFHICKTDVKRGYVMTANRMIYDIHSGPTGGGGKTYIYNVFEELSEPGDYFIDRKNNAAYVIPRGNINKTVFVIPTLDAPVFSFTEQANHIRLENIAVRYTRGMAAYLSCVFGVGFESCDFAHGGMQGIFIRHSFGTRINGCRIYDFGRGGIVSEQVGEGYNPGVKQLFITNCDIYDTSRAVHCYSSCVCFRWSHGIILSGCKIHGSAHAVINFNRSSDIIIENNEIYDGVKDTDDAALIYYNGGVNTMGVIIRNNYFHDWGTDYASWGVNAIYADGGTGADIYNNIFVGDDADRPGFTVIKAHAESMTNIHNNIFLTPARYYSLGAWDRKEDYGILAWIPYMYGCKTSRAFVGGFEYDSALQSGFLGMGWRNYYKGTIWESVWDIAKPDDMLKIYNKKLELLAAGEDEDIISTKLTIMAQALAWNHKMPDGSIYEGDMWDCIKTEFKDIYDKAMAEVEGKSELEVLKRTETLGLEMFWFGHLIPINTVRAYNNLCIGVSDKYIEPDGKENLGHYSAETELIMKDATVDGESIFVDERNGNFNLTDKALAYVQSKISFNNDIGIKG